MKLVENNNPICIDNFHGENHQVINVNFGNGRIGVSSGVKHYTLSKEAKEDEVLPFVSFDVLKKSANIGDDLINAKDDPVNHDYPEVHLNFTDERSIDIVIKALEDVKNRLVELKNENLK